MATIDLPAARAERVNAPRGAYGQAPVHAVLAHEPNRDVRFAAKAVFVTDGGKIMAVRHVRVVVGALAAIGMIASTAPAHAVAEYARGEFNYPTVGESLCIEIYVNSGIGSASCAARIEVGLFGAVVRHSQDGTCTGIAPAKLWITSPSIHSAPPANGHVFVSHGEGVFHGYGSNGVIVSTATARLTGSRCSAQDVLGPDQSLTGSYLLHA